MDITAIVCIALGVAGCAIAIWGLCRIESQAEQVRCPESLDPY